MADAAAVVFIVGLCFPFKSQNGYNPFRVLNPSLYQFKVICPPKMVSRGKGVKRGRINDIFAAPSVVPPAGRFQPGVRCYWPPLSPRVLWPSLSATPADRTGACPGSKVACTEHKNESAERRQKSQQRGIGIDCGRERRMEEALCTPVLATTRKNERQPYEYNVSNLKSFGGQRKGIESAVHDIHMCWPGAHMTVVGFNTIIA